MPYKVHIIDRKTGEKRVYIETMPWRDSVSWWQEGNMSCDCNRLQCFMLAAGETPPDETPCYYEEFPRRRFTIPFIELESGEVVEIDDGATKGLSHGSG